jgi:hypothetical protein
MRCWSSRLSRRLISAIPVASADRQLQHFVPGVSNMPCAADIYLTPKQSSPVSTSRSFAVNLWAGPSIKLPLYPNPAIRRAVNGPVNSVLFGK